MATTIDRGLPRHLNHLKEPAGTIQAARTIQALRTAQAARTQAARTISSSTRRPRPVGPQLVDMEPTPLSTPLPQNPKGPQRGYATAHREPRNPKHRPSRFTSNKKRKAEMPLEKPSQRQRQKVETMAFEYDAAAIQRTKMLPTREECPDLPKTFKEQPKNAIMNATQGIVKTARVRSIITMVKETHFRCTAIFTLPTEKPVEALGEGTNKVRCQPRNSNAS